MKKIYTIFVMALVVVSASVVTSQIALEPAEREIINATINNTPRSVTISRFDGNITFLVGRDEHYCYLSENDMDIDDEFEDECIKNIRGVITNIKDYMDRRYEAVIINNVTYRSFNTSKLRQLVNQSLEEEGRI